MAVLLVVALGLLLAMSWRSLQRLEPVHTHIEELDRMRAAQLHAQELLLDMVSGARLVDPEQLQGLRIEIDEINAMRGERGFGTRSRLRRVHAVLGDTRSNPSEALAFTLNSLREFTTRHFLSTQ
jgi:hypothetical protein